MVFETANIVHLDEMAKRNQMNLRQKEKAASVKAKE
jgi:hypothetical protein